MQTPKRVAIIDVLRGWALLVVVISNYLYYAYSPEGEINGKGFWSAIIQFIERYFFSAKGWTLLFVLFGFGFGVLYTRMQHKTYVFLIRRLLVLLVFAFFNSLLFDGDILRDYAILGLLFLFFLHFSVRKLGITIAAFVLIIPFLAAKINSIDNSYVTALSNSIAPLRFTASASGTKPLARLHSSPPHSSGRVSWSGSNILSRSIKVRATSTQVRNRAASVPQPGVMTMATATESRAVSSSTSG